MAEPASYQLTESIARHGITYGRMKTGTPVRIDARSVHFDQMETQDGESDFHKFSFMNTSTHHLKQLQCWTCYTNEEVHRILREGLPDSPYSTDRFKVSGHAIVRASKLRLSLSRIKISTSYFSNRKEKRHKSYILTDSLLRFRWKYKLQH